MLTGCRRAAVVVASLWVAVAWMGMPAQAGVVAIGNTVVDWSAMTLSLPPRASIISRSSLSEGDVTYFSSPEATGVTDPSGPPTSDTSTDWGDTGFTASLLSGNVRGRGTTTAEQLAGNGFISLVGEDGQAAMAGGHFVREAEIFLLEAGTISFSVPYELTLQLSTSRQGELALGILLIDAYLVGQSPDSPIDVDSTLFGWTVANGDSFNDSRSGTLTLQGTFAAGETVGLGVDGFAYVEGYLSMPSPGATSMLGLGVLALLLRRRARPAA